jgi:hypothetical protein
MLLILVPVLLFGQQKLPSIVVLGVTHSEQLVNYNQQPAVIRSYIDRVHPAAICFERSPEEYSRNDFYEFTFEQQYCVIPYAKERNIPLYPIDWIPEQRDILLAFGVSDLEVPAFTRNPEGFWGFTVFPDSTSLYESLWYAEDSSWNAENSKWYTQYPERVNRDFARRLFLFRTFMQAKHIEAVAKNFTNDTLLVIIGSQHKNDLENHLRSDGFSVILSSIFGPITRREISDHFRPADAYAICLFNLLGIQSRIRFVNDQLLQMAFSELASINTPETRFFRVRYQLHKNAISAQKAIEEYTRLLTDVTKQSEFTWTGVKYHNRTDSYFDPFGNMTLYQRLHLELAREYFALNDKVHYEHEREVVISEFKGIKKSMLQDYWARYVEQ